jgi:hypothetical protein
MTNSPSFETSSDPNNLCPSSVFTSSGRLLVDAVFVQDRMLHRLWVDGFVVFQSLEGTADDAWPVSPPFQELVSEPLAAGKRPVLLGVGKAGRAHWSAAIEGDAMEEAMAFDIACRTPNVPERLLSSYQASNDWKIESLREQAIIFRRRNSPSIVLEVIGTSKIDRMDNRFSIHASIDSQPVRIGHTYRWRYVVRTSEA